MFKEFVQFFFFGPSDVCIAFFPLIPLAIAGISGLAGALGNRKQKKESTEDSTTTTTPNYDPTSMNFRNQIISNYFSQLQNPVDLSGYEAGGIEDINRTRELQAQKTKESFGSRGIQGPALDFATSGIDNNRFSDIIKLHQQTPLLQHNMQADILKNAGSFFQSIPYGQTNVKKASGTETTPGNVAAGGLGNIASTLAYFLGNGAFKGGGGGGNV